MAALMILNYHVSDREALEAYRTAARVLLLGPGGGELVAMSAATLDLAEGAPAGPDTVVIRFESRAAAEAAYRDPAYQAVLGARLAATAPVVGLIVETLD